MKDVVIKFTFNPYTKEFLWSTNEDDLMQGNFKIKNISSLNELTHLFNEKGLSKEDLTLILKTISQLWCMVQVFLYQNRKNLLFE